MLSFVAAIFVGSYAFVYLPPSWLTSTKDISKFSLAMAMAAIGLQINPRELSKGASHSLLLSSFARLLMLLLTIATSLVLLG